MTDDVRRSLVELGLARTPVQPIALTPSDVQSVCDSAPFEGLVPLLGAAIESGLMTCAAEDRERVIELWMERMAWCVQLDGVLVEVVGRLTAAGIDVRVLKGAAVALLDELVPAWRSYGDVDVLVRRDQLLAATDVLADAGWLPAIAPVSRRWAARHAKSLTLVDASGVQIDVHRLLATGPMGVRVEEDALFAGGESFEVGGVQVMALRRPQRFLHACYHAALGGTRGARHDRDLLLLAGLVAPVEVADLWDDGWSPTVVAAALTPLAGALGAGWADWLPTVQPDREALRMLELAGEDFHRRATAHAVGSRWSTRLSYSAALVWPSRANLKARGLTRRSHLASLLQRAMRVRR